VAQFAALIAATSILLLATCADLTTAGIIPPPWVDFARNPCAKESWQLLYWPADGKCYRIFQQGPCRDTFELVFDARSGAAECRCPHQHVMWIGDGTCYKEFSRGPCGSDEYLLSSVIPDRGGDKNNSTIASTIGKRETTGNEVGDLRRQAECAKKKTCPEGWLFWPPDGQCYANYTRVRFFFFSHYTPQAPIIGQSPNIGQPEFTRAF
jgi:hypothetical protein